MNSAQIHLALNHVPLFFSVVGGLFLVYALIKKSDALVSISCYMLIAGAIFTIPVFLTGHGTEEMVEEISGVSKGLIEEHEEMAQVSLWIISITGAVALAALFLRKSKTLSKAMILGAIILSFVSFGVMAQTAHLGGQIRHSELAQGPVLGNEQSKDGSEGKETKEDKLIREDKGKNQDDD